MSIRNLGPALRPRSVAVIGASVRDGAVGQRIFRAIRDGGFSGPVFPVNPKYADVDGVPCVGRVADLAEVPDLAIIVTPPKTVAGLITDLGRKGCRAAVIITAGLTRDNGLRQAALDAARPFLLRLFGPNTLGLIVPPASLNASFAHMAPRAGTLALMAQSGAISTSLIDWAGEREIGFSLVAPLGDMADVDTGDLFDLLAGDRDTRAVLAYLETITSPRKFLSAARALSRVKPVVAIKAGRHAEAARAAATHTGALAGGDRVAAAALRRAGVLRVDDLGELFAAAEVLTRMKPLERARLAIVTNGGGAGVLAIDSLLESGGELATLAETTIGALDKVLPATWSRGNPVDVIGDAPPERYREALVAVAGDPGVDAILVMNCPTALASSLDAAEAVAALAEGGRIGGKPVFAAWLGEMTARAARTVLQRAGIATFATPADAARAVSWVDDWSRVQRALLRVPSHSGDDVSGRREDVRAIFRAAAADGRAMLTEPEAKAVLAAYGLPVPEVIVAADPDEASDAALILLAKGHDKVVVKLLSKTITHKSDVGGVVLGIADPAGARTAALGIAERLAAAVPGATPDGYAVQPMIQRRDAHELIIGMHRDPIFGPAILFGAGGVAVETLDDTAIGLPPLDDVLGGDMIDATRVGRLLKGYRDRKPANRAALTEALNTVSALVVDFACIDSLDINPIWADENGVVALDARIAIDPARVEETGTNRDLSIRPWPADWQRSVSVDEGVSYRLRPIRPADVSLYAAFFARTTPEDMRMRFLTPRRHFSHEALVRLTQLDYDRDIAFVALDQAGELCGVSRLAGDPDRESAEYAVLVRSDLSGHGIGSALMDILIEYARAEGLKRLSGYVLAENTRMLEFIRRMDFRIRSIAEEPGVVLATKELRGAD